MSKKAKPDRQHMPTKKPVKKARVNSSNRFISTSLFSNTRALIVVLGVAVVGVALLIKTQAAVPPPATGGYFTTLAPGSSLPTDADCANRVHHSSWESRPENQTANNTVPTSVSIPGYTMASGGVDDRSRALANRVTGNFKGTTDEIIQWASCKWGFNDDIVRAVAAHESWWKQGALGDIINDQSLCQVGYTAPCAQSFGITQVKATKHPGTFPASRDSTAFNIDYALMYRRVCFEGYTTWLKSSYPNYGVGDEWGCVGQWNSGGWYDAAAQNYITNVKNYFNSKPWLAWPDQSITDSTAPTQPANVTATAQSSTQINLSWSASSDNVSVSGYDLYRNNTKLTTVGSTSFADSGLMPNTTYTYYVIAKDAAGNSSPASTTVSVMTPGTPSPPALDTTAPTASITSPANGATVGSSVSIKASATDNVRVARMEVWIDGSRKASNTNAGSITYNWSTKKTSRGAHTITVKAYDATGNAGQASRTVYR